MALNPIILQKTRTIAVIVKVEHKTAKILNHTNNGIYIADINGRPIPNQDELNCNDQDLHAVFESRVLIVPNVTPGQTLKLVFGETTQEVEFTVPLDKECCEVTL